MIAISRYARRVSLFCRRLWSSVAFRLTFTYNMLAVGTTALLLIFAHGKIVDVVETQFVRQMTLASNRLVMHHEQRGIDALRREIDELLSDQTDIDTEIFLLMDPGREKIAGNLDVPQRGRWEGMWGEVIAEDVVRNGVRVSAYLIGQRLHDGSTLIIGRDTRDLVEIESLVRRAVFAATVVAIFLVLIGTAIFRRELRQRVEAIRDTARDVGTGALHSRVPTHHQGDEFDQLRADINHMLDQIETLMNGVRNVSDSIAHNVRTPLTRVLGRLDQARQQSADGLLQTQTLERVSTEIMDIIAMSERLLLITEVEAGLRRQPFMPVRLDAIAHDVVELYEALAEEQRLRLIYRAAPNSPFQPNAAAVWVQGDADLLASVLTNLMDNALKYVPSGGTVTISLSRERAYALLIVADNGPGVAASDLPQLSERFFRGDAQGPGSGLGLTSVRAVVQLHDGEVSFHDNRPGLRVCIKLPLTEAPV